VLGTILIVRLAGWSHIALDPALPRVGYWAYLTQDSSRTARNRNSGRRGSALVLSRASSRLCAALCSAAGIRAAGYRKLWREAPSHLAIATYALLLAVTTFVIRIWYPQDRWIGFLGFIQMEPAHMPQYASLFVIGLFAGPRRWLQTMPAQRGLIWLVIGGGLAIMLYLLVGLGLIGSGTTGADNASTTGAHAFMKRFSASGCASDCPCCFAS